MAETLVKSKERVKGYGEVFTPAWIVNDMLNMEGVKEACFELDKTFLEPACGDGNFLIQIVARKLKAARDLAKTPEEYNLLTFKALSTVYAVDIQKDNVDDSIERIKRFVIEGKSYKREHGTQNWTDEQNEYLMGAASYKEITGAEIDSTLLNTYVNILQRNFIHGNCLTGMKYDDLNQPTSENMIFYQYNLQADNTVKLEGFTLEQIKTGASSEEQYEPINWLNIANAKLVESEMMQSVNTEDYDF